MALETGVPNGGSALRASAIRRRCLLAALASTAIFAATTFDFSPLLPDENSYDWTMWILGVYLYVLWPASLLGLVGSIVIYVAVLIRPDFVVRRLMPERPTRCTTEAP
ncbi:MAG: hypothetical protein HUU06_00415 [Planctomycetaceae bacterium]|nr:hypothetical protein [Planctomycetota bacterium]NUN51238.1 hypothetical protein [Planctomycetaceae bacterium]